MPTLTIRKLDEEVRDQLRIQAATHGRSMEAEVRSILKWYIRRNKSNPKLLARRINKRFSQIDDGNLELPERQKLSPPILLDE